MKNNLRIAIAGFIVVFLTTSLQAQNRNSLKLVEVTKIWDKAPHNAFTDLIRFHDRWFCVFRESSGHVKSDGSLRVISSADGKNWESAALLKSSDSDLRDAKITITPNGKLMLSGAEALHDKTKYTHQSLAWFSDDGTDWSEKVEIGDPNFWLWRTTFHKNIAYSLGYGCAENKSLRLYKSSDGENFTTLVKDMNIHGYPNETSIIFKKDTAFCLLRRGGNPNTGMIGISTPPYINWEWKDLGVRIGGPDMILLTDGRFLTAVRLYDGENWHPARTSLCWVNPYTGEFIEALKLPSGGDTSYAGMVFYNGLLWVSYYSSHEEKTTIYLAKVKIEK